MRVCLLLLGLGVLGLSAAQNLDRKLTSEINPGCDDCDANNTLVYVKAIGDNDTIHHIWDFTRNIPTMILAVGDLNSTVYFKWDGKRPSEIFLPEKPTYSFAVAIDRVLEYEDKDDTAHYNPHTVIRQYSLKSLTWERTETKLSDSRALVAMKSVLPSISTDRVATIHIKMDVIPNQMFSSEIPHLSQTANSALVDVSMVNLTATPGFHASRFALHYVVLSVEDYVTENTTMEYKVYKSLDDERSPGVFELIGVQSPSSEAGAGGYVQFRPVAYTQPERTLEASTPAHFDNLNRTLIPINSTMSLFYGNFDPNSLLVQDFIISFGVTGDGFYKKCNYTVWTYSVGYGRPPLELYTALVAATMLFTLGMVPAVALLLLLLRAAQRARRRRPGPRLARA